jgi:HSP20 family molecular chaperone IbpA
MTTLIGLRGFGLLSDLRIEDYVEDDTYVVRAEIPGIDPEKDLEVTLEEDVLTISGERKEEQRDRNHSELHYGSFTRSVRLPRHARTEDVNATCHDGMLEVRVQLDAAPAPRRSIPVQHVENGKDS